MKRLSFSDDMMRALAAGEKTMTRRPEKRATGDRPWQRWTRSDMAPELVWSTVHLRPRFRVGDLAAATCAHIPVMGFRDDGSAYCSAIYKFRVSGDAAEMKYRTSRVMPAALAPFVLRITEVRAENLSEITDADAVREGATRREWPGTGYHSVNGMRSGWSMSWSDLGKLSRFAGGFYPRGQERPLTEDDVCLSSARSAFGNYWNKLYGEGAWEDDKNSWVWVYGFEIAERGI